MKHPVVKIDKDGREEHVSIDNCKPVFKLNEAIAEDDEHNLNDEPIEIPEIPLNVQMPVPAPRRPPQRQLRNRNVQYGEDYNV